MNNWKAALAQAFEAPAPVRKGEFLHQINLPGLSVSGFLLSQMGYIRKISWLISILIFCVSVFGFAFLPGAVLWLVSGLTPLLALTLISETGRSELYKMAELEMATRFSLRSVIFARLVIIGLMNTLLLGILLFLGLRSTAVPPYAAAVYIITPFLLTAFIGLHIVRKHRGQEAMYACVGASVGISVLLFLSHLAVPFLYREQCIAAWMVAALAMLMGSGKQCAALIMKTEEMGWN